MAYADAANYNTARAMRGLPVGAIMPWSGDLATIPPGWVTCNGTTVPTTRYPLLYEVIGNTYGGVANSTFTIPRLNNSPKAIVDIFRGHYNWLRQREEAHRPETTVIGSDPYWSDIGQGDNGNQGGTTRTDWISTIDVVGVISNMPNLVARYTGVELSEGQYQSTVSFNERKLSDRHVPSHSHGYANTDATAWSRNNSQSLLCGSWAPDFQCGINASCTTISRAVTGGSDSQVVRGNNSANMTAQGGAGGGTFQSVPPVGPQSAALEYQAGNGAASGNMTPAAGTNFATSLSNPEVSFAQIQGHNHGANQIEFNSGISVIDPGIVSDVALGSVTINNDPGRDFAIINMSSATANLSMIFIIRAY